MATFSVTTTSDQDAAAAYYADKYNQSFPAPPTQLTTLQWGKLQIDNLFTSLANAFKSDTSVSRAKEYLNMQTLATSGDQTATADKSAVDTMLAKYS